MNFICHCLVIVSSNWMQTQDIAELENWFAALQAIILRAPLWRCCRGSEHRKECQAQRKSKRTDKLLREHNDWFLKPCRKQHQHVHSLAILDAVDAVDCGCNML